MTGSLRTHVNGAISIWSYRVTLSPLLRSAKRPAWDRVLPNAVVAQTPSSEMVNSLSTARTVSLYQVCEAISASTPTILGHAVGHEREQNSIRQRIRLDEIVVVRSSVFSKPYSSIARHVTKYGKPQGGVRETNRKPVRDRPGALGWRRGS